MDLFNDHSQSYAGLIGSAMANGRKEMAHKVFVAGITGVIGSALAPLLLDAGYTVFGSTRRADRARELEDAGVVPVVVDVFDAAALREALVRIAPACVIHQLTDLPPGLDPARRLPYTCSSKCRRSHELITRKNASYSVSFRAR